MAAQRKISALSADELMAEMRTFGLKVGPITQTTRKVFEKKLARVRGEKLNCDIEEICVISSHEDVAPRQLSTDMTDFMSIGIQRDNSSSNNTSFYYGVSFDRNDMDEGVSCIPAVFTTKHEALDAVRKLKDRSARFKPFKTRHEAEIFSLSSCSTASSTNASKVTDPASSFKSPKPQEIVKFRKILEKGSSQEFVDLVNSNPKYLISSGDTPVILQEGYRYNGMHIAAKENKPAMCKLIVETLESDGFWQRYLSFDKDTMTQTSNERKQVLVDLYLNTPEKGNFETPLHFACKFGHIDVVEYLVSHPLTNVSSRNKYGDTPDQVAGSRCSSQKSVIKIKDRITHLLEDNYYVPVFGSEGDATPPSIGKPWSPDIHRTGKRIPCYSSPGKHSPVDPRVTVRAYAGPMSPKKAFEFHHKWKTPPSNLEDRKKYVNIKRGDNTRGLERIGRSLAHSHDIPWTEYWDFLGYFIDFATPPGLEALEEYLSTKQKKIIPNNVSTTPNQQATNDLCSTPASGRSDVSDVFISDTEESPLHMDITNKMAANDDTSPTFQAMECSKQKTSLNTKSPLPSQTDVCDGPQGIDRVVICNTKTEALRLDFENLVISPESQTNEIPAESTLKNECLSGTPSSKPSLNSPGGSSEESHFILCKKNLFDVLNESGDKEDFVLGNEPLPPPPLIDMRIQKPSILKTLDQKMLSEGKDQLVDKHNVDLKLLENTGNTFETTLSSSTVLDKGLETNESQSSSAFGTSPEERKSRVDEQELIMTDVRQDNLIKSKPSRGQKEMTIFIDGFYPSKLDLDVLRALDGVTIFRDKHPLVSRWRDLIMSHKSNVRESWPSPGSPLFISRRRSMLAWSC